MVDERETAFGDRRLAQKYYRFPLCPNESCVKVAFWNTRALFMQCSIVDSFTNTAFKGNPAGVCILDHPLTDERMLNIAGELNLSETAFLQSSEQSGSFSIRYFSPKKEIPLCGHATLASAKVVSELYRLRNVSFVNVQNITLATSVSEGEITMAFPAYDTVPAEAPPMLLTALGIEAVENVLFNQETNILMLEIADPEVLVDLAPDFGGAAASP
ncbi:MAG: PhzF family phenazine biosynthesis protein [Gammaproteobacteria bacterium]|nr:PhzF family phenazine biosynthesis protein [Gammaproteobacteria bacterium]